MRGLALPVTSKNAPGFGGRMAGAQALGFTDFVLVAQDDDAPIRPALEAAQANGSRIRVLMLQEGPATRRRPDRPGFAKLSSTDRGVREASAAMVLSTLKKLGRMGLTTIVLDGGTVVADGAREALLSLSATSEDGAEGRGLSELMALRERVVYGHLESLTRSMYEVSRGADGLELAVVTPDSPMGVCLPDQMDALLGDDPKARRWYWHSTGSAQCLERLGVVPSEAWLERFGGRMAGMLLSDSIGCEAGQLPGLGEVDFRRVAGYLRPDTLRVMSAGDDTAGLRLMFGRDHLAQVGIF